MFIVLVDTISFVCSSLLKLMRSVLPIEGQLNGSYRAIDVAVGVSCKLVDISVNNIEKFN